MAVNNEVESVSSNSRIGGLQGKIIAFSDFSQSLHSKSPTWQPIDSYHFKNDSHWFLMTLTVVIDLPSLNEAEMDAPVARARGRRIFSSANLSAVPMIYVVS